MFDDKARAMLGDHEAAERLTDAGELLPCPWCNRKPEIEYDTMGPFMWVAVCPLCAVNQTCCDEEWQARLAWNTRAPILSESELKKLCEGGEED